MNFSNTFGREEFKAVCRVMMVNSDVTQRYVLAGYCVVSIRNVIHDINTTIAHGKYMAGMNMMLFLTKVNSICSFDQLPDE